MTTAKKAAPKKTARTTPKKKPSPSYTAVLQAVEDGKFNEEQLWELQKACAWQQLEEGSGGRWVIRNPYVGEFNEDDTTAEEYRIVAQRIPGLTLQEMGFADMMQNPQLIYEFMRAHLVVIKQKDPEEADIIVGRLTMKTLIQSVNLEVVKPDPK